MHCLDVPSHTSVCNSYKARRNAHGTKGFEIDKLADTLICGLWATTKLF